MGDICEFKFRLKIHLKPKKQKHFRRGTKRGNSLLTQLRVGRSQLNAHKFTLGLSDTDKCVCERPETVLPSSVKAQAQASSSQQLA